MRTQLAYFSLIDSSISLHSIINSYSEPSSVGMKASCFRAPYLFLRVPGYDYTTNSYELHLYNVDTDSSILFDGGMPYNVSKHGTYVHYSRNSAGAVVQHAHTKEIIPLQGLRPLYFSDTEEYLVGHLPKDTTVYIAKLYFDSETLDTLFTLKGDSITYLKQMSNGLIHFGPYGSPTVISQEDFESRNFANGTHLEGLGGNGWGYDINMKTGDYIAISIDEVRLGNYLRGQPLMTVLE